MEQTGIHCLPTLLKRLEAVVSRLEDIAISTSLNTSPATLLLGGRGSVPHSVPVSREVAESRKVSRRRGSEELPKTVASFDTFLRDVVGNFCDISQRIGGVVGDQAALLQKGFTAQRSVLLAASRAKKPDASVITSNAYQQLLCPIEEAIAAGQAMQQKGRHTPAFDMLSAVTDGSFVLTWVTVEGKPWKRVEESFAMAQYFGNKVLMSAKRDSLHTQWVEAFYAIFRELEVFLREEYPYGIVWNGGGEDLSVVINKL